MKLRAEQRGRSLFDQFAQFLEILPRQLQITVGGITVAFSTTGDFSQWDQQTSATDPSLRNIGFANYQLNFSASIHSLSFDIGGLDTAWGDVIHSFLADSNPIGLTTGTPTNISQGFNLHMAVWIGSQLLPGSEQDNGALVFFGPTVISTLTFSSSGNGYPLDSTDHHGLWLLVSGKRVLADSDTEALRRQLPTSQSIPFVN